MPQSQPCHPATVSCDAAYALQNLESLDVAYCGAITDSAMRSLSRLTALTRLNFGRCKKVGGGTFVVALHSCSSRNLMEHLCGLLKHECPRQFASRES